MSDQIDAPPSRPTRRRRARFNYRAPIVKGPAPCRYCGEPLTGPAHPLGRHVPGCPNGPAGTP